MAARYGPHNRDVYISSVFRILNRCRFSALKSLPFPLPPGLTFHAYVSAAGAKNWCHFSALGLAVRVVKSTPRACCAHAATAAPPAGRRWQIHPDGSTNPTVTLQCVVSQVTHFAEALPLVKAVSTDNKGLDTIPETMRFFPMLTSTMRYVGVR